MSPAKNKIYINENIEWNFNFDISRYLRIRKLTDYIKKIINIFSCIWLKFIIKMIINKIVFIHIETQYL